MTAPRGWVAAAVLILSCSGHSQDSSPNRGHAGSADSGPSSGSSGDDDQVDPMPESAAGTANAAGSSGQLNAAGQAGQESLIRSGTRSCENRNYCFGLACYAPATFEPSICLTHCESDANCARNEACLLAPKLEATCFARCNSPADCDYGFDCLDFSGEGQLVCFPAAWAQRRNELGY